MGNEASNVFDRVRQRLFKELLDYFDTGVYGPHNSVGNHLTWSQSK